MTHREDEQTLFVILSVLFLMSLPAAGLAQLYDVKVAPHCDLDGTGPQQDATTVGRAFAHFRGGFDFLLDFTQHNV